MESKYGGWRGLDEASNDSHASLWWRDLKLAIHNPQYETALQGGIVWKVGSGDKIRFWEDRWLDGDTTLLAKYPRLYLISCQHNQTIQEMGVQEVNGWEWKFEWRRNLFENELVMADCFLNDVNGDIIQPHRRDAWIWKPHPSGQYSIRSVYDVLRGEDFEGDDVKVFEELWKLRIPPKFAVFAWRLLKDCHQKRI